MPKKGNFYQKGYVLVENSESETQEKKQAKHRRKHRKKRRPNIGENTGKNAEKTHKNPCENWFYSYVMHTSLVVSLSDV